MQHHPICAMRTLYTHATTTVAIAMYAACWQCCATTAVIEVGWGANSQWIRCVIGRVPYYAVSEAERGIRCVIGRVPYYAVSNAE